MEEHLNERHLDMDLHRVWLDNEQNIATFPLWNLSGQLVGYQQYRPDASKKKKNSPKEGRYYSYISSGSRGVWGLESWSLSPALFLTEGIFDAARLTSLGLSAIAVLSNDPVFLKPWLIPVWSSRHVVAICDYGPAGHKLAKYGHSYWSMPEEFDLGDAPDDYVKQIIGDQ